MTDSIISGQQPTITDKTANDAAADARYIMANSNNIPKYLAVDIISRQIFLLMRDATARALEADWDIEQPQLVHNILGMSAQERAVSAVANPHDLRDAILYTVLPLIDIFCRMEEDGRARETVSGSDNDDDSRGTGDIAGADSAE